MFHLLDISPNATRTLELEHLQLVRMSKNLALPQPQEAHRPLQRLDPLVEETVPDPKHGLKGQARRE